MLKSFVVFTIVFYQVWISSLIKMIIGVDGTCRFSPSCSEYAKRAIIRFGIVRGIWLGVKRVSRCSPLGSFGYDRNF